MKNHKTEDGSGNIVIRTGKGELFDVPLEGSLGLLALGATGLAAWRKKRKEAEQKKKNG